MNVRTYVGILLYIACNSGCECCLTLTTIFIHVHAVLFIMSAVRHARMLVCIYTAPRMWLATGPSKLFFIASRNVTYVPMYVCAYAHAKALTCCSVSTVQCLCVWIGYTGVQHGFIRCMVSQLIQEVFVWCGF